MCLRRTLRRAFAGVLSQQSCWLLGFAQSLKLRDIVHIRCPSKPASQVNP